MYFFVRTIKMLRWQWNLSGKWIDCLEENNEIFSTRFQMPSMEPLYLTNNYGELWGCPENKHMKFRIHDGEEVLRSAVRRYNRSDPTICVVYHGNHRTLLPPSTQLFETRAEELRPLSKYTEVSIGTELFVAHEGKIFQKINGKLKECTWKTTNVSVEQYKDMATSRFVWEFNGPFRLERMRTAVHTTGCSLPPSERRKLNRLFAKFRPGDEGATEYGPYQFPDFLCAHGEEGLSCQIADNYHSQSLQGWRSFDGITNAKIEKRRRDGHSAIVVTVHGEDYMLLFDSGGGASGQPPVVIRPARYNKILSSIEEQFRETTLRELFDMLIVGGINPVSFLRCSNPEEMLADVSNREALMSCFHQVTHSSQYIATLIQSFMPTLLDKYRECDIRLSQIEYLSPKKLCSEVAQTIDTGLNVPNKWGFCCYCPNFPTLVDFIQTTQSWITDRPPNGDCHICLASECVVLRHCGTATACLKCWVDTLTETKMKCPFCRQPVEGGQLVCYPSEQSDPQVHRNKRRRRFQNVTDVLNIIHEDQQYADIRLDTINTMRKWFTILVNRHIVDISEIPAQNHSIEKNLTNALTEFKIL